MLSQEEASLVLKRIRCCLGNSRHEEATGFQIVSKDLGTETKFTWSSKHPSEWEWIQRRNGSRGNMSASAHIKWAFKGSALRLHRRPRTLQHKWMVNTWNRRFSTGGLRPQSGSGSFVGHFPLFIHFFLKDFWNLEFEMGHFWNKRKCWTFILKDTQLNITMFLVDRIESVLGFVFVVKYEFLEINYRVFILSKKSADNGTPQVKNNCLGFHETACTQ